MKLTITNVAPGNMDLTPCLHVHLRIEHGLTNLCHLNVIGLMFSSDGKLLATGEEITDGDYSPSVGDFKKISSCNILVEAPPNSDIEHFDTILKFPVNSKVFEHIESLRLANEHRDVFLNFLFKIVFIEHNFRFDSYSNTIGLQSTDQSLGKVNLFNVRQLREKKNECRIPSGDWINKYMNPLGHGKVIVFEINQPLLDDISNFVSKDIDVPRFKQRIEAAISSLYKMENYIKKGDWIQVAEQLRDIQLFKSDIKTDVKTLLEKSTNLPADKIEKFAMALDHLYDVSSQFHHSVNQGKVNPIVNVNQEDAYFIYMLMLSITQLVIKKLDYLRRNSLQL